MEQKPISGAEPLARPSADVAQAYLAEVDAVTQRRETRIDRRRMARLQLIEAVVLAFYATLMMFGFGNASSSASFMPVVAVLLLWVQFAGELRESYGFQQRRSWRGNLPLIAFGAVGVIALIVGVALQLSDQQIPLLLRVAPGALLLLVFGALGLLEYRQAHGARAVAPARAEFAKGSRVSTLVLGLLLGGAVAVVGQEDPLLASTFGLLFMMSLLGWFIAAQISSRVPALGMMWRWPQWSAFAIGGVAVGAVTALESTSTALGAAVTAGIGGGVALLFVVAAVWGERRDS